MIKETVLCYIKNKIDKDKYLFIYRNKKINDYNYGKYLGVGGHIEKDETRDQAVIREIKEETNFDVSTSDLSYLGKIIFKNKINDNLYEEIMYLYKCDNYNGILSSCDEGTFYWVNKADIFDLNLWEGDKCFLKYVINENDIKPFEMILNYVNDEFINQEIIK